jgi:hypothetical protein
MFAGSVCAVFLALGTLQANSKPACALYTDDEEALCNVSRWFMKEYQFSTDSYRLFSGLNRLCNAPTSWYNSGPSQKFVLRQIKAMDFSLLGHEAGGSFFHEKASWSTKDENGNPVPAKDLDVALLMLYGHILYIGTSYSYALSKFHTSSIVVTDLRLTIKTRLFFPRLRPRSWKPYDQSITSSGLHSSRTETAI